MTNNKHFKTVVSFLLCISIFSVVIAQPVRADNIFSNLLNNFFSLFGNSSEPTPTPAVTKQEGQLQKSVNKLLDTSTVSPTITSKLTTNKSSTPSGTVEKIIDYTKYPEMIDAFLPKTNLLEESKKYATGSSALNFLNSYLVQIDTENTNEKIIHVKPGYCTMRLFMPKTPTDTAGKSVAQKSYQEVKMLDCRSKRE